MRSQIRAGKFLDNDASSRYGDSPKFIARMGYRIEKSGPDVLSESVQNFKMIGKV